MSYDVILMGFRLNNGEAPAKVLERVLGLDAAKAKLATQRFPVILARTSAEKAERIANVLREAGASVELRENRESGPRDVAPAPPAAPPPPPPPAVARPLPDLPPPPKLAPPPALGLPPPSLEGAHGASMVGRELQPAASPGAQAALEVSAGLPAPTRAPASVLSAQPDNDQGTPGGAMARATDYQLGDLDLGGPPPAAKPAPAAAPPASSEAPALDVAIPPRASAVAPAPAPSGFGGDSGMQSFGDGLDDHEGAAGPALELDTEAAWLKKQKAAPAPEKARPAETAPAAQDAVRPSPRPPKPQQPYVLPPPPPLYKRLLIAVEDGLIAARPVALNFLVFLLVTLLSAVAVAFARNPDATFELVGLAAPPPAASALEIPVVSASSIGDGEDDPRLHPLLRVAPPELQPDVLTLLRKRVPGVHTVNVSWPGRSDLTIRDLQCVLVEQASNDAKGRELIAHVNALLRTGEALEVPESVHAQLERAKPGLRKKLARPNARFVELCLAI